MLNTPSVSLQKLPGNTSRQPQLRNACFTINNPTVEAAELVQTLTCTGLVAYLVLGKEIGESGTPHFQGYIEFHNSVEFTRVHELLLHGHIEARRGTPEQALEYCKKDNEFWEWGTVSQQGRRTDIAAVADMVKDSQSIANIAAEYPVQYIKFHKGIMALQAALIQPRITIPEVRVFFGQTGCGKSHSARTWLPNAYVWHPQQGQWFDGYHGQDTVIFEEFRGQIPFGMLLSLLDRYCCKVQYKGGVTEFAATKIAITSPESPYKWYLCLDNDDRVDQLLRRISELVHLRERYTDTV